MEIAPEFEILGHRWRVELIIEMQDVFGARESRSCPMRTSIPFSSLWTLHFHWKPSCLLIGVLQDNLASSSEIGTDSNIYSTIEYVSTHLCTRTRTSDVMIVARRIHPVLPICISD